MEMLVKVVRALLRNEHLGLEPYLHQIIPSILTCAVAKSLCATPAEDHWALRDLAAAQVCTLSVRPSLWCFTSSVQVHIAAM